MRCARWLARCYTTSRHIGIVSWRVVSCRVVSLRTHAHTRARTQLGTLSARRWACGSVCLPIIPTWFLLRATAFPRALLLPVSTTPLPAPRARPESCPRTPGFGLATSASFRLPWPARVSAPRRGSLRDALSMATAPQNRFADSKAFRDPEVAASQRQGTDAPLLYGRWPVCRFARLRARSRRRALCCVRRPRVCRGSRMVAGMFDTLISMHVAAFGFRGNPASHPQSGISPAAMCCWRVSSVAYLHGGWVQYMRV